MSVPGISFPLIVKVRRYATVFAKIVGILSPHACPHYLSSAYLVRHSRIRNPNNRRSHFDPNNHRSGCITFAYIYRVKLGSSSAFYNIFFVSNSTSSVVRRTPHTYSIFINLSYKYEVSIHCTHGYFYTYLYLCIIYTLLLLLLYIVFTQNLSDTIY